MVEQMLQNASFFFRRYTGRHLLCRHAISAAKLSRSTAVWYTASASTLKPIHSSGIKNKHLQQRQVYTEHNDPESTIYALSTAPGKAGIAIIYQNLCPLKQIPKPRYASLRTLYDPTATGAILDSDALVLYFPAPNTVTGEDVLELHIHGGSATIKAVLAAIAKISSKQNVRYAEPGEFTRRAFHNNKLDLAQVEALGDTLSAETEQQRRAAVRGNSGKLGRTYESWRENLLYARGELEALIDFSEDQYFDETPGELLGSVKDQVQVILRSIAQHDSASHRGELLKRGIKIALLGAPNAGKSSLLNQIVGREASIVSHEAGTTRDIVEASLDIRGYLCTFADTAGLRESVVDQSGLDSKNIGAVELEGIRRAKTKAQESDVIVALASVKRDEIAGWKIHCDEETLRIAREAPNFMVLVNKCDLVTPEVLEDLLVQFRHSHHFDTDVGTQIVPISCRDIHAVFTGAEMGNLNQFVSMLVMLFENMTAMPPDLADMLGVTERQRQLLLLCADSLNDFVEEANGMSSERDADIVIAAEHLRAAANCLARITGRGEAGDVEEVLGVVFEKFCVGK